MSKDPAATPDSLSPTELHQLFQRHGFRPRRALGQTFLIDANTVRRIVASAELTGDEPVLEVGAGAGAVTRGLMAAARR
ncbi:MAG: 16S rRNA (adenine(1518)-N(6)/adenine(1519)-N(6))-dimethyltransferase RsmA, partial [Armatimonadota bacterium]|nr:16S rRNA (adenine(1518)-N(6)/adenine(1519)-N(6))-dimethyltransferase RsmA [Armatimonadota bacterium]